MRLSSPASAPKPPPDPDTAHHYTGPVDEDAADPALIEACRAAMRGHDFLYPEAVVAFIVREGMLAVA